MLEEAAPELEGDAEADGVTMETVPPGTDTMGVLVLDGELDGRTVETVPPGTDTMGVLVPDVELEGLTIETVPPGTDTTGVLVPEWELDGVTVDETVLLVETDTWGVLEEAVPDLEDDGELDGEPDGVTVDETVLPGTDTWELLVPDGELVGVRELVTGVEVGTTVGITVGVDVGQVTPAALMRRNFIQSE